LAKYLEEVPNRYLMIKENQTFFLLLTQKGDPEWRYRVDELHPQARDHRPWGSFFGVTGSL